MDSQNQNYEKKNRLRKNFYDRELIILQKELVKLQEWVKKTGLRVAILFEGRDAAGKGGAIKRISSCLNPRICRVVALGIPTERERGQWYFQRYIQHLPTKGEIVLFDRSWYNRAGVERVMGLCNDDEYNEFMESCPAFEKLLVRSGLILIKYWFSISDEEQELRFQRRVNNPMKRWKISKMDLESRNHWIEYSQAKDEMFKRTNISEAPWHILEADDKRRARLNCIRHILSVISYEDVIPDALNLPPRRLAEGYIRPPRLVDNYVSDAYDNID